MRTDPQVMHRTADRLTVLSDELWDDIDTIRSEVENLMAAGWTGIAAKSHAALWDEWVDSARQAVAALSNDAALLHQAADGYTRTDDSNAETSSGLALAIKS